MKTEEGNKLIAEFMGGYINPEKTFEWIFPDYYTNQLSYHESWEWLMPVVEKIAIDHVSFQLHIGNVGATSKFERTPNVKNRMKFGHAYHDRGGTILSTWLAVVEFIKWYNQQK